jgi:hypothetical protein
MTYIDTIKKLRPDFKGRLAGHHVCYLGDGHVHRALPYNANDPAIVAKKVGLMQSNGFNINIGTWQGPWATACHAEAQLTAAQCAADGLQFALLLDPGGMQRWRANQSTAQITANTVQALNDAGTQKILHAANYIPEKYVLDFNTGADLTHLKSVFPALNFLKMGEGFSWPSIPSITESKARNLACVANLKGQNAHTNMKIPGLCFGFNDSGQPLPVGVQSQTNFDLAGGVRDYSKGTWGNPARILEGFGGLFFQQQLAVTPAKDIWAIVTIDDVDEQTAIEERMAEAAGLVW